MNLRFLLFVTLFITSANAHTAERFLMNFELVAGEKTVNKGNAIVTNKKKTWQKGLQRSFLALDCRQNKTGGLEKLFSTVDHFTGLRVTHRLVGKNLELNVVRIVGQARITEIRALPKGKCKDLSPLFTTTTQAYTFPAKRDVDESRQFDVNMTFQARIRAVGGTL